MGKPDLTDEARERFRRLNDHLIHALACLDAGIVLMDGRRVTRAEWLGLCATFFDAMARAGALDATAEESLKRSSRE